MIGKIMKKLVGENIELVLAKRQIMILEGQANNYRDAIRKLEKALRDILKKRNDEVDEIARAIKSKNAEKELSPDEADAEQSARDEAEHYRCCPPRH
jgi:predicted phage gp36 major capsid-like protein